MEMDQTEGMEITVKQVPRVSRSAIGNKIEIVHCMKNLIYTKSLNANLVHIYTEQIYVNLILRAVVLK